MHLLKSTASSIRAGRAAQHHVQGSFQYAFGCARGLLADAPSIEDVLILNADPSNAEEEWRDAHKTGNNRFEQHSQWNFNHLHNFFFEVMKI